VINELRNGREGLALVDVVAPTVSHQPIVDQFGLVPVRKKQPVSVIPHTGQIRSRFLSPILSLVWGVSGGLGPQHWPTLKQLPRPPSKIMQAPPPKLCLLPRLTKLHLYYKVIA
jgi:hypothetical protein